MTIGWWIVPFVVTIVALAGIISLWAGKLFNCNFGNGTDRFELTAIAVQTTILSWLAWGILA